MVLEGICTRVATAMHDVHAEAPQPILGEHHLTDHSFKQFHKMYAQPVKPECLAASLRKRAEKFNKLLPRVLQAAEQGLKIVYSDRVQAVSDSVLGVSELNALVEDSGCTKRVEVFREQGKWSVEICIPWQAFSVPGIPNPGTVWQFAVCRYNYSGGLDAAEHSSIAPLAALSFHRHEEYCELVF